MTMQSEFADSHHELANTKQDEVDLEDLKTTDHSHIENICTKPSGHNLASQEPATNRWELWSWYAYSFGNNSMGPLSYAPLIFQSVLYQAGFAAGNPAQSCGDPTVPCVVHFGNSVININTVVLMSNGIAFAFQAFILIFLGSMSDYGSAKRWVLLTSTLVCWASQFGFLSATEPSRYRAITGMYILSSFSYNICTIFWLPAFPLLARNTAPILSAREKLWAGEISEKKYESIAAAERNRLTNRGYGWLSVGQVFLLVIALGAAYGLHADDSAEKNLRAALVIIAVSAGLWILCGTPWFFLEKQRAPPLPKGESYFSVGAKATWQVMKHTSNLRQTWIFLIAYFLITDGCSTTAQLYVLCQNSIVSFSTTTSTKLYIVQSVSNAAGIVAFWLIQTYWKVRTKVMFTAVVVILVVLAVWGCIGIGTTRFGLHQVWEVWAFSVAVCLFSTPYFALAASFLSDLCPKGREVTFFALFGLVSRATSWIGPIICSVIIDRTGSIWTGFPFALGLTVVGFVLLCFVDVEAGQRQCEEWTLNDPTLNQPKP